MRQGRIQPQGRARGFTIIEILLALAFITIISSLPFFGSRFLFSANNLLLTEQTVVHGLRQAQLFAQSEKHGGAWGLRATSDRLVIFQGDSYDTRLPQYDEQVDFTGTYQISGLDEIVFEKFTGEPSATGDMTISNGASIKHITMMSHGLLDY